MKSLTWFIGAWCGLTVFAVASPIQVTVDSPDDLRKIGASIHHEPVPKKDESDYLSFKISWSPTFKIPEHSEYRMDLILGNAGELGQGLDTRAQIRWKPNAKGVCEADFSLTRSELAKALLAFWGSDNYAYFLSINAFVSGFPEPRDEVFFVETKKPNKAREDKRENRRP